MKSILGRKQGTTQLFNEKGELCHVTVISAGPCYVTQVKTRERDGRATLQLGFAERKKGTNKAHKGHFKKAGTPDLRFLREFAVNDGEARKPGDVVKVDVLNGVGLVDVTGTTKGRGFAGCVRRHGFNRGPVTHGSKNIREPGSAGQKTFPARVFPGKRMPGQLGNQQRTIRSISVFRVDPERDLLLLRGAVPGPIGGLLVIRQAIKELNK